MIVEVNDVSMPASVVLPVIVAATPRRSMVEARKDGLLLDIPSPHCDRVLSLWNEAVDRLGCCGLTPIGIDWFAEDDPVHLSVKIRKSQAGKEKR